MIFENCQMEYDPERGVLYVHNKDTGITLLRVCRLPIARFREGKDAVSSIDVAAQTDHSSVLIVPLMG